jgi:LDH2 family malate/lactate/ureidoglycolate dehydrogenase
MRIDAFRPAEEFKSSMDEWITTFRNAKPVNGQQVLIPGDIERENEKKIKESGICLQECVVEDLKSIAHTFSLTFSEM